MRTEAELEQLRADIAAQDRERQEAGQLRAEIERLATDNEYLKADAEHLTVANADLRAKVECLTAKNGNLRAAILFARSVAEMDGLAQWVEHFDKALGNSQKDTCQ